MVQVHRLKVNGANCWIYAPSDTDAPDTPRIVIDPGADAPAIIHHLEKLNAYPSHILLTHGHFDHVGALPDLVRSYSNRGLSVEIAIQREDALYLGQDSLKIHQLCWTSVSGDSGYIDNYWKPLPEADRLLEEGDIIGGLRVLSLPGHSPGSAAFFDEKERVIFTGDCLFKNGVGRTDLPGGDKAMLEESLHRLFTLDPDITICPGHGGISTIGAERDFWAGWG